MRAHDADSGEVLYRIDTTRSYDTITGEKTHGGSFGGASGATANYIHIGNLAAHNLLAGDTLVTPKISSGVAIGTVDSEGFLKITDRKKEMFKTSGGKYIAPQHIENKLKDTW